MLPVFHFSTGLQAQLHNGKRSQIVPAIRTNGHATHGWVSGRQTQIDAVRKP